MLLAREGRKQRHLAEFLGTTLQTANNKMRGETRFQAHEIKRLAEVFEEGVDVFYDPAKPIGTTPVMPPVPEPGLDLLTSTKYQALLVRALGDRSAVGGCNCHLAEQAA